MIPEQVRPRALALVVRILLELLRRLVPMAGLYWAAAECNGRHCLRCVSGNYIGCQTDQYMIRRMAACSSRDNPLRAAGNRHLLPRNPPAADMDVLLPKPPSFSPQSSAAQLPFARPSSAFGFLQKPVGLLRAFDLGAILHYPFL